jgi:hypothetical protein
MTDRDVNYNLHYKVDKGDLNASLKATDALEEGVEGVKDQLGGLGKAAKVSVDRLRESFEKLKNTSKETATGLGKTEQEADALRKTAESLMKQFDEINRGHQIDEIAQALIEASNNADTFDDKLKDINARLAQMGATEAEVRRVAQTFERGTRAQPAPRQQSIEDPDLNMFNPRRKVNRGELARQGVGDISTLGSSVASVVGGSSAAGQAFGAAGDIAGVAEYLPKLGPAIAALGPAGLAAGAAVGVLAVGVTVLSSEIEKGAQVTRGLINEQRTYFQLITTGTRENLEGRRRQILEERRINDQVIADNKQRLNELIGNTGAPGSAVADITNIGGAREYREAIQAAEASNRALAGALLLVGEGLDDNVTALNDEKAAREASIIAAEAAAQAERDLAKARADAILGYGEQIQQDYLENIRLGEMSSQQLEDYLQKKEDEADALRFAIGNLRVWEAQLIAAGEDATQVGDQIEAYGKELETEVGIIDNLRGRLLLLIKAREAEAAAAQQSTDLANRFIQGARDIIGGASDGIQALAPEVRKATEDYSDIIRKRDDALLKSAQKLNDSLQQLGQDYLEQDAKADSQGLKQLRKFHEQEEQRVKQHQLALSQIARDGSYSIEAAAGDGNIRAAQEAERSLKNQLKDKQDGFDLESEQRAVDLEDLRQSLQEQDRERAANYQRRYQELMQANRQEVNDIRSKYQTEISDRRQAFLLQIADTRTAINADNSIRQQGHTSMLAAATNYVSGLLQQASRLGTAPSNAIIPDSDIITIEEARRRGLIPPLATASFPTNYPTMGGSTSVSSTSISLGGINVNGASGDPEKIAAAVERRVVTTLTQRLNLQQQQQRRL